MKDTDKREVILLKAEELFSKHGFKGTSTRSLAKAAKVNLGMLTYYFGTKDKILRALIDRKLGFYRDSFMMIDKLDVPTIKKVEAIIDVYVEHMIANRRFHRILQSEVMSDKHSASLEYAYSVIKENRQFLIRILEKGKKNKEFRDVDCSLFMTSITGSIMQIIKSENLVLSCLTASEKIEAVDDPKFISRMKVFLKEIAHGYLLEQSKKK